MDEGLSSGNGSATSPSVATTRAGIVLHIRKAQPADVGILADIYAHLTEQDMRFRLKRPIKQLESAELENLVDEAAGMTSYLAFAEDTAAACATLIRDPSRNSAEVILSVRPEWKGRGVSWTLLEDVMTRAAKAGLTRITSREFRDDREAINLQREMGFVARLQCADPIEFAMVKAI